MIQRINEGTHFELYLGVKSGANNLLKVYLPAIAGHVPSQMVRALGAFLDFCYLVRHDIIDEAALDAIDDALARFHRDRVVFHDV